MVETQSLREWIRNEVRAVLSRKVTPPPLLFWCDPDRAWRDLLQAAIEGSGFELWCEDEHELILRDRLFRSEARPRVIWLPRGLDEITYLKVFEIQAEHVWTESLVEALCRFGMEIPRDREAELHDLLPAHAKEWIDRPRSAWRELTVETAKTTLVDDDRILAALARPGTPISEVVGKERMGVFARRVTEDLGLPAPSEGKDDPWRIAATARLLVTEAAARVPADPPSAGDQLIPPGPARERALKLLDRWQKNVEWMAAFEDLARRADATTSLVYWARNLGGTCPPLASRAAEDALFQREVSFLWGQGSGDRGRENRPPAPSPRSLSYELARLEDFELLAKRLEEREGSYSDHAKGFWALRAELRVPWASLVVLARAAILLRSESSAENLWANPRDAVEWFVRAGWEVDRQGEALFKDDPDLPGGLQAVRARLRRAYLRHVDRTNAVFSNLVHHHGLESLKLRYAGEVLAGARPAKEPMAVIVLDACRFDLGARLVERLNKGEPARRAEVTPAIAPLPSITALGMAFALADDPSTLRVELTAETPVRWRVTATGTAGDLTAAEVRREWLRRRFKLKTPAVTEVKAILDAPPPSPKEAGRLLFVFGDELDTQGHEGELRFTGAEEQLERYGRAVRMLRDAGYTTVAVVTDHGFIHWEPEKDEVDDPPSGEILWRSRRAIVGRGLKHPTALTVPVPGSDLECRVPRSVNAFRTYGGIGYFHGGATLQELVIPVVVFRWPKKAEKVAVVLTPLSEITSLKPRIEVKPGGIVQANLYGVEARMMGRQVVVKVVEPGSGRRLFRSPQSYKVDPEGQPIAFALEREGNETCQRGARLHVEVRDADNDELLDHCEVELKIDLEEWD